MTAHPSIGVKLDTESSRFAAKPIMRRKPAEQRNLKPFVERAIVDAVDAEQRRLAQVLHDTVCQSLSGIGLLSKVVASGLEAHSPMAASDLADLGGAIGSTIREIHWLIRSLRPVAPGDLSATLSELATCISTKVPCAYHRPEAPLEIQDGFMATQLSQIAHQAVLDASRRLQVSNIVIILRQCEGRTELRIEDDGHPGDGPDGDGLELIQLRARIIGAAFTRSIGPETGTVVLCSL